MSPTRKDRRRGPFGRSVAPATAAFIAVFSAIGVVTRYLGIEAGLLALVLAVVALVVAPYIYLPASRHTDDEESDPDRSST